MSDARPRLATRLSGKGGVVVLSLLAAIVITLTAGRTWLAGRPDDPVLGTAEVTATGSEAAAGLVPLALVLAAAAVATVSGGRIIRALGILFGAFASAGAAVFTLVVATHPADTLGTRAATLAGRTGSIPVDSRTTVWVWLALVGPTLGLLAMGVAARASRRWRGPSDRYERGARSGADEAGRTVSGARGERVGSDWDRLSAGEDPTDPGPHETDVGSAARPD